MKTKHPQFIHFDQFGRGIEIYQVLWEIAHFDRISVLKVLFQRVYNSRFKLIAYF